VGFEALTSDTTGGANTAVGRGALDQNVTGNFNTAIGKDAGGLATGSGNVYIGHLIAGVAGENDHTYIRNINTTSVSGGGTDTVTVNVTTGLLGHATSSRRYKEAIKPMDNSSQALFALKPVTFRYKKEIDPSQSLEYGLVAEEVAQVDPSLAILDKNGQIDSVRYNAINAMLLNEFLKEHSKVEKLTKDFRATVAQQQKEIQALAATVKEQAQQIQKVSAQLEASKPAAQVVKNNQ
jgi:HAMP domain-containing protein